MRDIIIVYRFNQVKSKTYNCFICLWYGSVLGQIFIFFVFQNVNFNLGNSNFAIIHFGKIQVNAMSSEVLNIPR